MYLFNAKEGNDEEQSNKKTWCIENREQNDRRQSCLVSNHTDANGLNTKRQRMAEWVF